LKIQKIIPITSNRNNISPIILGSRTQFVITRNIASTRNKIKHTKEIISNFEQYKIKLIARVLQSKRSDSHIQLIQEQIEYTDRCIRARHRSLAKYKRILHNLQHELKSNSRKNYQHISIGKQ
jgi:hypothetical protein